MKLMIKAVYFVVFVVLIAGCSHSATFKRSVPITSNLAKYDQVSIVVKAANAQIEAKKGFSITKEDFEKAIVENLAAGNTYKDVYLFNKSTPPKSGYKLVMTFTDFEYLSGAASVMGGMFAGNAKLKVHTKLVDVKNKKLLGEFALASETSAVGGIFRGSTSDLIEVIAKEISKEILLNTKKL